MDSTAAWLLPMCWDMVRHRIAFRQPEANGFVANFLSRVKLRAEQNMAYTGKISGAHWNAMRVVAQEMGIKTDL